jgi:(1->4)-alpha-D-glucan 1-alpha-D-glucosylmutase
VLKLTAPGVPDIYQGCETWQFNLVDPDNRRPVPFRSLQATLDAVQSAFHNTGQVPSETLHGWLHEPASGHIKMLLTWRLLALRSRVPELFAKGGYKALEAHGPAAARVVAFMRQGPDRGQPGCVVLCSRLLHGASPGDWTRTSVSWPSSLPSRQAEDGRQETSWADWLTGQPVAIETTPADKENQPATCQIAMTDVFHPLPMAVLVPADWLR